MKSTVEFEFVWNEPNSVGQLNPNDLHFFYYDVVAESLTKAPCLYEWDAKVESFLSERGMEVPSCTIEELREKVFEADKMFFSLADDETKPEAFFRHLRNAFAHFNLNHSGDYIYMRDYKKDGKTVSMIGQLKMDDLKDLCFQFFDQRESIIEKVEQQNQQTI